MQVRRNERKVLGTFEIGSTYHWWSGEQPHNGNPLISDGASSIPHESWVVIRFAYASSTCCSSSSSAHYQSKFRKQPMNRNYEWKFEVNCTWRNTNTDSLRSGDFWQSLDEKIYFLSFVEFTELSSVAFAQQMVTYRFSSFCILCFSVCRRRQKTAIN